MDDWVIRGQSLDDWKLHWMKRYPGYGETGKAGKDEQSLRIWGFKTCTIKQNLYNRCVWRDLRGPNIVLPSWWLKLDYREFGRNWKIYSNLPKLHLSGLYTCVCTQRPMHFTFCSLYWKSAVTNALCATLLHYPTAKTDKSS